MGSEATRAAKCVLLTSGLRAGVRTLLRVLPKQVLNDATVLDVRAQLASHIHPHPRRESKDAVVIERELRELLALATRLVAACRVEGEAGGSFGMAAERLRVSVCLARCALDRGRSSMPPPLSRRNTVPPR